MRIHGRRSSRLPIALVVAVLGACEDRPATQVMISIATDLDAPVPLGQLTMDIERFVDEQQMYVQIRDKELTKQWEIDKDTGFELPGSLVTYTGTKGAPKVRVTLIAKTRLGEGMVQRRAVFRLIREKTLYVRMGITERCLNNADCPDEKTCIEGRCRDPELQRLPEYQPARRPELNVECESGTTFRNTSTGMALVPFSPTCPGDQVCLEGACYPADVFGTPLPAPQMLTIALQVNDITGMPVNNAIIRPEDGPVSLVRRLRTVGAPAPATPPVLSNGLGLYQLQTTTYALTTELKLTVDAPNFVPQVVSIPVKPGVTRYQAPAVLFPLESVTLMPGENRPLTLQGGGRTATFQVPVPADAAAPVRVRYALMDGRHLPGQAIRSGAGGDLLQASAVLYLENVGLDSFPMNTKVTLGAATTPAVFGAGGGAAAYRLDMQGQWSPRAGTFQDATAPLLNPESGGFWTIANVTQQPACVRGKVKRPDGSACAGARVRLLGPEGVSSSDSTGADGGFCGGAAQQEAAILAVGGSTRTIYVPASARNGAHCGLTEGVDPCTDIGDVVVARPEDCDSPPVVIAGRQQPGATCTATQDCAGLASCYQGFCVSESFARVSMTWTVASDFDLHVKLPTGEVINAETRLVMGKGRIDVDQCTTADKCQGTKHLENIILTGAPGNYEVWAQNYVPGLAGDATIEVFVGGKPRLLMPEVVGVPAPEKVKSRSVTFTLP
jgi:hypothetical protein